MEEYRSDCINKLHKIIRNKSKSKIIENSINRFSIDLVKDNKLEFFLKIIYNKN